MKLTLHSVSYLSFGLVVACHLIEFALAYLSGYCKWLSSVLVFFLFLRITRAFAFATLFAILIISIRRKQKYIILFMAIIGFLGLNCALGFSGIANRMILLGVRDRVMKRDNLEEIRRFAFAFHELSPISGRSISPTAKIYYNSDLLKAGLFDKYSFLNCFDVQAVVEEGGVVCIRGGRPSRGCCIEVSGDKIKHPDNSNSQMLRVSDDIAFMVENN